MHEINLAGLILEGPVMNAAGTCKTADEAKKLVSTGVCAIVYGSYTYNEQTGNAGATYHFDNKGVFSINSKGIPNGGRKWLQNNVSELVAIAHNAQKAAIFSVSSSNPEEVAELVEICFEGGADAVEINLACPNLWIESDVGKAKQKPIVCFYPEMIEAIAEAVIRRVGKNRRIGGKISPFSNPVELGRIANIMVKTGLFRYFIATNTFPNGVALDFLLISYLQLIFLKLFDLIRNLNCYFDRFLYIEL
jgi:dihydroorotate dehydrogenase (fumarate)